MRARARNEILENSGVVLRNSLLVNLETDKLNKHVKKLGRLHSARHKVEDAVDRNRPDGDKEGCG